jgi:hypothetical protein
MPADMDNQELKPNLHCAGCKDHGPLAPEPQCLCIPHDTLAPADQEPVAWREGQTGVGICFDDGILNLNRDGSGSLCFRDDALEFETNDETGKLYRYVNIAASEIRAIRDELNKWFPPTSVDRNAVLEEAVRQAAHNAEPSRHGVLLHATDWHAIMDALRTEAPAQEGE